jgi:transglutaminase-like putative cysteine protease
MKLRIYHHTRYEYTGGVFLEPHILRFHPRPDHHLKVQSFELNISPKPGGQAHHVGTSSHFEQAIWFEGVADHLDLEATSVVETLHTNPLNFLLYPFTATRLPMVYEQAWQEQMAAFTQPVSHHPELRRFAKEMMLEADYLTVPFLALVNQTIFEQYKYERREAGNPYLPEYTIMLRRGSCRDLAYLLMAVCREAGLAARFVSGYYFSPIAERRHELHAWVEVYLPGAGWRGYDPSQGLMVADRHVAVAAASHTETCAPVTGSYRGAVGASLKTKVRVERLADDQ